MISKNYIITCSATEDITEKEKGHVIVRIGKEETGERRNGILLHV
jgi:hypothetical protein